jgi:hypothetical protein
VIEDATDSNGSVAEMDVTIAYRIENEHPPFTVAVFRDEPTEMYEGVNDPIRRVEVPLLYKRDKRLLQRSEMNCRTQPNTWSVLQEPI